MCHPRPSFLFLNPIFATPFEFSARLRRLALPRILQLFNFSIFQFFTNWVSWRRQVAKLAVPNDRVLSVLHLLPSEVQGKRRAELARAMLSRSLHSPLLHLSNGKGTNFFWIVQEKRRLFFSFGAKYSTIHLLTLSINGLRSTMLMRDMALYSLIHLFKYDRNVFRSTKFKVLDCSKPVL